VEYELDFSTERKHNIVMSGRRKNEGVERRRKRGARMIRRS